MGTKRALVPAVGEIVSHAQAGTFLDAFAGMCSVGEAIANTRQVWTNDAQLFATEVARALFTSKAPPPTPLFYGDNHFEDFRKHRLRLSEAFSNAIGVEQALLNTRSFTAFNRETRRFDQALKLDIQNCRLRTPRLFSVTYSGTFFGISQAVEIDAVYAALKSAEAKKLISADQHRWGIIALGRTLLKLSNSTGHFAQYLKPKITSFKRHIALRRRSVWEEWLTSIALMIPAGSPGWRKNNRVFNQDSLELISRLTQSNTDIGVIYADPPYTNDQYSRFYHVLETLLLYDYPRVTGAGIYRTGRFQTAFSMKAQSAAALEHLIRDSARTGADLVLSYPTNGLAVEAGANVQNILKRHFRRVEVCHSMMHRHSTFGASKGPSKSTAIELIYWARSA